MTPDYIQMGKRIVQLRQQMGLSQPKLGTLAGIGHKHLSSIERAASIPSLEALVRLAQVLDTTPDELLFGSTRQETKQWRGVAEMLRGMNPTQLDLARSFFLWLEKADIAPIVENGEQPDESD